MIRSVKAVSQDMFDHRLQRWALIKEGLSLPYLWYLCDLWFTIQSAHASPLSLASLGPNFAALRFRTWGGMRNRPSPRLRAFA